MDPRNKRRGLPQATGQRQSFRELHHEYNIYLVPTNDNKNWRPRAQPEAQVPHLDPGPEIALNNIRTTPQALLALADDCNSLRTNAYDEAITTLDLRRQETYLLIGPLFDRPCFRRALDLRWSAKDEGGPM